MKDEMINIGVMPTGAMQVFKVPEATCSGFEPGAFLISYKIESGIQKDYHENPGVEYQGTSREAYVPNNVEGRALIQRLIYAFAHGMTFRVGVSMTTGQPNSVTWASIPHKTSLTYGPFGYPDSKYLKDVNEQLNILGVPSVFPVFSTDEDCNS
jgi:deltex-like protein